MNYIKNIQCTKWLKEVSIKAVKQMDDSFGEKCSKEFEKRFGCRIEFQTSMYDMAYEDVEGLRICAYPSYEKKGICFIDSGPWAMEIKNLYDLGQAFIRLEKNKAK